MYSSTVGFFWLIKKHTTIIEVSLLVLFSFAAGWLSHSALRSGLSIGLEASDTEPRSPILKSSQSELMRYPHQTAVDEQNGSTILSVNLTQSDRLEVFSTSLLAADYSRALLQYQDMASASNVEVAQAKSELLAHLDHLLKNSSVQQFVDLTDQYLSIYYDDVDVLLYLARFNYSLGDMMEASAVYRLINSYAYSAEQIRKLRQSVGVFIGEVDVYYTASSDFYELITIYTELDSNGLLQPRHQLAFAKVYLSQGNTLGAMALLKRLKNQSEVASSVRVLMNEIELKEEEEIVPVERSYSDQIALKPHGNQFSLDLNIDGSMVDLLIDTGASMTTISQQQFQRSFMRDDFIFVEQRLFNTANGIAKGAVYRVNSVELGGFILRDVHIAVLDFDLAGQLGGLLGMNVLGQFHFQIDQNNSRLLLSERY